MSLLTNKYFVASDYDLTLRLQKLFHETVSLQAELDNSEFKDECIELELKVEEAHNEISLLVKKIKHLLADSEIVETPVQPTLSASKRNN